MPRPGRIEVELILNLVTGMQLWRICLLRYISTLKTASHSTTEGVYSESKSLAVMCTVQYTAKIHLFKNCPNSVYLTGQNRFKAEKGETDQ